MNRRGRFFQNLREGASTPINIPTEDQSPRPSPVSSDDYYRTGLDSSHRTSGMSDDELRTARDPSPMTSGTSDYEFRTALNPPQGDAGVYALSGGGRSRIA